MNKEGERESIANYDDDDETKTNRSTPTTLNVALPP